MSGTVPAPDYQIPKHSKQSSAACFKAVFLKGKKECKVPQEIDFFYQSPASIGHVDTAFWWKEQSLAN